MKIIPNKIKMYFNQDDFVDLCSLVARKKGNKL